MIQIKSIKFDATDDTGLVPVYYCTISVEYRTNVTGTYGFKTLNNKWNIMPRNISENVLLRLINQEQI